VPSNHSKNPPPPSSENDSTEPRNKSISMDKSTHRQENSVGYKKPPRHSQFKPGQSGNPKGRPKKGTTFQDVIAKQLRARVPILSHGKRRKISMLEAIIRQNLSRAANGDMKALAIIFKYLTEIKAETGNNLSDLVREFRALHSRHMAEESEPEVRRAGKSC
jgi:hypothetical protein